MGGIANTSEGGLKIQKDLDKLEHWILSYKSGEISKDLYLAKKNQ